MCAGCEQSHTNGTLVKYVYKYMSKLNNNIVIESSAADVVAKVVVNLVVAVLVVALVAVGSESAEAEVMAPVMEGTARGFANLTTKVSLPVSHSER